MARVSKTGTGGKTKTGTGGKKSTGRKNKGYTMSTSALIQRKTNNGTMPAMTPEEVDFNAKVITHSMQTIEISKNADMHDPESLLSCFQNYMALCLQNGMRIGNIGACVAMGITQATLALWKSGSSQSEDPI